MIRKEDMNALTKARDAAVLVSLLDDEAQLDREALLDLFRPLVGADLAWFRVRESHIADFEEKLAECPEEVRAELERHATLSKAEVECCKKSTKAFPDEVRESFRSFMRWKRINTFLLSEEGSSFPAGFECAPGFRGEVVEARRAAQACAAFYKALACVERWLDTPHKISR